MTLAQESAYSLIRLGCIEESTAIRTRTVIRCIGLIDSA